jgi:ABC-2 type transport system permease protein
MTIMEKLKTIYKMARAELQTLFYSPIAWLILIIFTFQANLVFTGVFGEWVRYQDMGYSLGDLTLRTFARFQGMFTAMQNYLYMYVPLLTMGLISREFSSGSIKLLYSSPLTNTQIILGKYLSMMIYGLVMIASLMISVLFSIATIEHVDIPSLFSGLLGLYLLICAYAAIGLFMSSLTSYQVVAAMGTFAILAALNWIGSMWQDIDFVRDITYWLSIKGRASEFINGLICSEDLLYFLIVSILFIALTIIRLQAKRQKLHFAMTFSKYLIVVIGAMLLGYSSSRPQWMAFYDATRTKANTLTRNSQNIISRMDGGLTMTTFVNILEPNYYNGLPRSRNEDFQRFKQYWRFKPEIKFKYIYYYDKAENPDLDRNYPNLSDRERMLKMTQSWRLDSNMFKRPEEMQEIMDLAPEKNRFVRLLERDNGQKTFLRIYDDLMRHPSESEISAAFKRLVMELPVVAFLTGHGERDCIREGDRDYNRFAQDKPFRYSLINNGFDFEEVTLNKDIPENVRILVIADMRNPLTSEEKIHLDNYIARGGNLLIAGEPRRQEMMNPLVESFGVQFMPGRLVKKSENYQPDFIITTPTQEAGEFSYIFKTMIARELVATMPGTTGLNYTTGKGFTVTPLFVSDTIDSWNEVETTDFVDDTVHLNPALGEIECSYVTALALSRKVGEKEQKIIIFGDADCISNGEISISRKNISASNYSLINGAFYWLSDEEVPINVTRPLTTDRKIRLTGKSMRVWRVILVGIIPAILIFFSILLWIRRRGR